MSQKFLWLDLEMSGLDVESCRILECAAIVTDEKWQEQKEGLFEIIVKQPDSVLDAMDDWCTKTHGESGLTEAVKKGTPEPEAEQAFLGFINKHFSADEKIVIAGNSIGQDRKFLDKYWLKVADRLHYRMLDVSSWKLVFKACYNEEFEKKGAHRALDDIRESINELKHYQSFVKPNSE